MFKTIKENVVAEIIEKKSKFIANLIYVQNIEEAEEIIKQTKKKYYDARHNCFAFCISTQDGIIKKSLPIKMLAFVADMLGLMSSKT